MQAVGDDIHPDGGDEHQPPPSTLGVIVPSYGGLFAVILRGDDLIPHDLLGGGQL
jgi:hypothetical protein